MRDQLSVNTNVYLGLKILTVGFLVSLFGFAVAVVVAHQIGWFVIWVGWSVAAVGLLIHFVLFFRRLFYKRKSL